MGRIPLPIGGATTGCNRTGESSCSYSSAPPPPVPPHITTALPLIPRLGEPVLVALGPQIGGRLLMKGVVGNMILDQSDHWGRGGEVNMPLNLSFPS